MCLAIAFVCGTLESATFQFFWKDFLFILPTWILFAFQLKKSSPIFAAVQKFTKFFKKLAASSLFYEKSGS